MISNFLFQAHILDRIAEHRAPPILALYADINEKFLGERCDW